MTFEEIEEPSRLGAPPPISLHRKLERPLYGSTRASLHRSSGHGSITLLGKQTRSATRPMPSVKGGSSAKAPLTARSAFAERLGPSAYPWQRPPEHSPAYATCAGYAEHIRSAYRINMAKKNKTLIICRQLTNKQTSASNKFITSRQQIITCFFITRSLNQQTKLCY